MELFSEIYSCYYQVLRHLLAESGPFTLRDLRGRIGQEGFAESLLSIIPRLEDGSWNLFDRDGELYLSKLSSPSVTPVTALEKSYLKALLADPRIGLFLEPCQQEALADMLAAVPPLWTPRQLYYYDRFSDGDPYEDAGYRQNFRTLLQAQKNGLYVEINYNSPGGNRVHHYYVPARLEYSIKNDKFRLLALKGPDNGKDGRMRLETLNLSRMQYVRLTDKKRSAPIDLNALIQDSYYREPLRVQIINRRNALERAMLHFANYRKNTTRIGEDTYECLIYYNRSMETELLIEVMSFGPMLTVMGNDRFLGLLKARLRKQMHLAAPADTPQSP